MRVARQPYAEGEEPGQVELFRLAEHQPGKDEASRRNGGGLRDPLDRAEIPDCWAYRDPSTYDDNPTED